ncbi:L-seryl-tRNA(Sec) selenium transferase [Halarcobacter ebronensis]|uniref:L-seryl-tRNA(Sec) selenium transferase n=1 Tax=Halarcobacter ebronensis TaxID=1462615 RepID=A0A4Q1ALY5_9BACT|nr:L-seryl-tRNA(Sec) selenium transferase [Halarcobacter ebronensis]QKF81787.1 selenocysteine synthase [Halarcobacter ebronensis]RXK04539.1 L-seryl-tRNA(Sec) selenium transferase [Halarcobacter ebronensis]
MILLKSIPKVDKFVSNPAFKNCSKQLIISIVKELFENLREEILSQRIDSINEEELVSKTLDKYNQITSSSLKKVINATGVIIHTNLGRSLIDKNVFDRVKEIATSYNNLEYNLEEGKRGERYAHISKIICKLLGCEDVLIVNNNASAVFLVLNTFAKNKEVIVSRGELVEIGGSFRIPDVMNSSGAILKEIGTTNKTHTKDYLNSINENTAMLMKVHKSNYSIEGFSQEVGFEKIIDMANENSLIDYYDMGSGHIVDLPYGLQNKEPSVLDYMKFNPSLLSFSGDKLLGSVQAGIIVGKKKYIEKLKKNQLLRMLRVDKLTLALLEENMKALLLEKYEEIPTLKMLFKTTDELKENATKLKNEIDSLCKCSLVNTSTLIGGGTTPNQRIPSVALSIQIKNYKPNKIEQLFRENKIIGRIENDKFLLDFKTIQDDEIKIIVEKIKEIING